MDFLRQEHPNPQFERQSWLNLNGKWNFQIDNSKSGLDKKFYKPEIKFDSLINVPFCPESELSGIGFKDFIYAVWYSRTFEIPKEYKNKKTFIHFGAVDYFCTVYVNGKEVGTHKGGYISFKFDISKFLVDGVNTVTVYAEDDVRNPLQPRGKQSEKFYSHGCDYTRTTGIWQTVWLEFTPEKHIEKFKIFPNAQNGYVDIQAIIAGAGNLSSEVFYEGKVVGKTTLNTNGGFVTLHIPLEETHLWEIGCGRLYDLTLCFEDDSVSTYFGLRDINYENKKFIINGKSVFQRLVLDQGFYPDGIYTAPSDEAMINDIQISLDVGFNGARLHEKIFEPRFLYHCDKMGYIVWGEFPNWGLDPSDPRIIYSVLPEWLEEIERDFNHPSIIGWCPFNETWDYDGRKQYDDALSTIYKATKACDTTRPCIDTSGFYHVLTDIFDVHNYNQDVVDFKATYDKLMTDGILVDEFDKQQTYNNEPVFVSEYGGIKWSIKTDNKDSWGYGDAPKTEKEFFDRYEGLTSALLNNDRIFGFCYTQLYDVEQEQNGLYTYSREPKFDTDVFKRINSCKAKIED